MCKVLVRNKDMAGLRAAEIVEDAGIAVEAIEPYDPTEEDFEPELILDDGERIVGVSAIKAYCRENRAA
jgi:hypothetical protein